MRKAKVLKKNVALLDAIDMGVWPSYLALLMYPYCREIPLKITCFQKTWCNVIILLLLDFKKMSPSKPTLRQQTHSCGGEKQEQRIPSTNSVPLRVNGAKTPRQQPPWNFFGETLAKPTNFEVEPSHLKNMIWSKWVRLPQKFEYIMKF